MEDRLQKFAVLVDAETFTKAAEVLHISQPALTTAVKKLERELGQKLLARLGNRFQMTSAGRLAYIEGKELAARRHNLKLQFGNLQNQKVSLAVGMIDSVTESLLESTDVLENLERVAHVSLSINNSQTLMTAVEQGRLDLAVVAKQPQKLSSRFEVTKLGAEPLVLVTHKSREAETKTQIAKGNLAQFLSYNQNSTTHQLILQTAARAGVELSPSFYSTSPAIIMRQVRGQKGVAALPFFLVKPYIESGELAPVLLDHSCIIERSIVAVWQSSRLLPPATHQMFDQITAMLTELMDQASQLDS
jgi:DNA-binding transcriptional LysR family regulator